MPVSSNFFLRLRELRNSATPIERVILEYILEYRDEIPHLSIHELAGRSHTSDASVLRFCKTLGYRGYRDFIVSASAALASSPEQGQAEYTDIRPGDSLATIIDNISFTNCKSIQDTMSVVDRSAIGRAVELLRNARLLMFYGIGASGLVCMDAQQKFARIGKTCFAYTDGHSQLTSACLLHPEDVAVLISNSGDTCEILDTLQTVKQTGAAAVAITRYAKSGLAAQADLVLSISTPEITIRSGAMGSRIAMLNLIDILFAGVASADYQAVKKDLSKTHNVLRSKHRRLQ